MKPRLLDLFCGAGGCTRGYQEAGFEVIGVDKEPMPNYCGDEFVQADALSFLETVLEDGVCLGAPLDAVHASPPCQAYSMANNANGRAYPELVAPSRELLGATGLPYVIENVVGAPLFNPVQMCGLALGLNVKRHRLFECNFPVMVPPCTGHDSNYFVIFGHEVRSRRHGDKAGRKNRIAAGREAMGIDWMTRGELSQAIPPAYTKHIGEYLLTHLAQPETEAA